MQLTSFFLALVSLSFALAALPLALALGLWSAATSRRT